MSYLRLAMAILLPALLAGTGCVDPLVGDWEADNDSQCLGSTDRTTFTVRAGLDGSGEVCGCDFSFDASNEGDDRYTVDLRFELLECGLSILASGDHDCELDGDSLDCEELGRFARAD